MKNAILKLALLILLAIVFQNIFSQRPKVGLVLSGGGAKGLAHIGILKAIDSAGLKIDYITGTSMGAIIAAMYAVGYSGKQIDSLNNTISWGNMFAGKPNFRSVNIEEKDEYDKYAFEVPFKRFKPGITTGIIESEEIYLYLNRVFFPFYEQKNFLKYNIPFKCIATDLTTGKVVVLDTNEIVKAVRASMAIPGVFESIEIKNKILVDGGIIRNFPVIDCKEMGADYIIGVNLFSGLFNPSQLKNAMDVMYQITQYRDAADLVYEKKLCNLVVEPPLSDYGAGSFGDVALINQIGKREGEKYYPYFKHLADSLNALEPIDYNPFTRITTSKSVVIDSMFSVGRVFTTNTMLREQLGIKFGGSYTADQLELAIRRAYGSLYYKTLVYDLLPTEHGHAVLKMYVRENEFNTIKIGLNFQSFSKGALIVNFTRRNLFFDKSRSMIKLAVGQNMRLLVQHRQYFGKQLKENITLTGNLSFMDYPVYQQDNPAYQQDNIIYQQDNIEYLYFERKTSATLNYCHEFRLRRSISLGTTFEHIYFYPAIAAKVRYQGSSSFLYSYLNYSVNSINRRYFPRRGTLGFLEGGMYFNNYYNIDRLDEVDVPGAHIFLPNTSYYSIKSSFTKFFPLTSKITMLHNVQGTISTLNPSNNYYFQNNFLGGIQPVISNQMTFVGYQETQINTSSFISSMLGFQIRTFGELYTLLRINIGLSDIYFNQKLFSKEHQRFRSGASLGVGYNLSFFPCELNVAYSPEFNGFSSNVSLGFMF